MLRGLFWLALASSTLVGTTACGGTEKPIKKTVKKYGEAYDASKSFDVLEERVDFLIHSGKLARAQEVAKAYYDSNATDVKGYGLYAETLLVGNKGQEALEIADSMISFNADDPA